MNVPSGTETLYCKRNKLWYYVTEKGKVRKMKRNRYDVEYDMNLLASEIASENDVEKDFYGDCYPIEIMDIENAMQKANDERYKELLNEAKEIFESYL